MNLSDHKIRSLKEGHYSDDGCTGLMVRVGKKRKAYYANMRVNGRKVMRRLGLADSMTLLQARLMVHRLRNGDGVEEESQPPHKDERTVSDLLNEFTERHLPTITERTARDYRLAIDHFGSQIGNLRVADVDRHLAQKLYDQLPGKGAMANRHLATMRKAWNLLEEDNPWSKVLKRKEKPRDQYAKAEELRAIMEVVQAQKVPDTRAIYTLILTTGCRVGEAQAMRWEDLEGKIWHKPKTKSGKAHRVVVPEVALKAIMELPHREGKVFHHNGFSNSWRRIKKDAGVSEELNIHDLRRSIAIELLKSRKVTIKDISNLLGHTSVAITERVYAPYLGDNREAVAATEDIFKKPDSKQKLNGA